MFFFLLLPLVTVQAGIFITIPDNAASDSLRNVTLSTPGKGMIWHITWPRSWGDLVIAHPSQGPLILEESGQNQMLTAPFATVSESENQAISQCIQSLSEQPLWVSPHWPLASIMILLAAVLITFISFKTLLARHWIRWCLAVSILAMGLCPSPPPLLIVKAQHTWAFQQTDAGDALSTWSQNNGRTISVYRDSIQSPSSWNPIRTDSPIAKAARKMKLTLHGESRGWWNSSYLFTLGNSSL